MVRTFDLFHLSLIGREQRDLFMKDASREEWLRYALQEQFQFIHRKRDFHWVPKSSRNGDIIGIVERQTRHPRHRPPDQGGTEIVEQVWQGAVVIIDPTTHDTGQRVAFERDHVVGTTFAVLRSLLEAVNSNPECPYIIEVKPIFDGRSFWTFAEKHNKVLRKITFDFVVPNMWGTRNELDKELRGTGKDTGAQKVKVVLDGKDGVKTESKVVREAVQYSEQGGASITARALDGDHYNSADKISKTRVDDEELVTGEQTTVWQRLAGKILRRG